MIPDWVQTYTGKKFSFRKLDVDNIDIVDIAHALSNICRFNGHCKKFYSVAEHSIYISKNCFDDLKLWGLLDDAAEAYIGDVVRPIKKYMFDYNNLEKSLMDLIVEKFNLFPKERPNEIVEIDNRILVSERDQIMSYSPDDWGLNYKPIDIIIECWSPEIAEKKFLDRFYELV